MPDASAARLPKPTRERVVKIEPSGQHYSLLVAPGGGFLGLDGFDESGASAVFSTADDRVMWKREADGFRHVATGRTAHLESGGRIVIDGRTLNERGEPGGAAAAFAVGHGPERLPSEYLRFFKEHGWVCLTCVPAARGCGWFATGSLHGRLCGAHAGPQDAAVQPECGVGANRGGTRLALGDSPIHAYRRHSLRAHAGAHRLGAR